MAVRSIYTKAEQDVIDDFNKRNQKVVGWVKPMEMPVATEESIIQFAMSVDRWNPLWHDKVYATGSRWGGLVAPPCYEGRFGGGGGYGALFASPECGYGDLKRVGEDWDFYRPVKPGDTIRTWNRRPQLKDVTSLDGKGPRKFGVLEADLDRVNQRDELISKFKLNVEVSFNPELPKPDAMPKLRLTQEELDYIEEVADKEEVRGANVRYWEDVNVGDRITEIAFGPTTVLDTAAFQGGGGMSPFDPKMTRKVLRNGQSLMGKMNRDPETGLYRFPGIERHLVDEAAQVEGKPRAFLFAVMSRAVLARLVTSWMGDDGFMKKFHWRHIALTPIGDALIAKGKVVNKRIENDEYLVDLEVWLDNLRGNIPEVAVATVSLLSQDHPYIWK